MDASLVKLPRAARAECRDRCARQQNGPHDLGATCPWSNLSTGLLSGHGLYRGVIYFNQRRMDRQRLRG